METLFQGDAAVAKAFKMVQNHDVLGLSKFLATRPHLINSRNKNGSTFLHVACWAGNLDMVLMLLFRGSDINAADDSNYTPILVAIEGNFTDLTLFLIERGANVNWRNDSLSSPLHLAAPSNHGDVLISLVQHGADINGLDEDDASPLVLAIESNNIENIITLIRLNADLLTGRDELNRRPLQILRDNDMLGLLAIAAEDPDDRVEMDMAETKVSAATEEVEVIKNDDLIHHASSIVTPPSAPPVLPPQQPNQQQQPQLQQQQQPLDDSIDASEFVAPLPDPNAAVRMKKHTHKKKRRGSGSVREGSIRDGSVYDGGSVLEGSMYDGSMIEGSVLESVTGSVMSASGGGKKKSKSKRSSSLGEVPSQSLAMEKFLSEPDRKKDKSKSKTKLTPDELRIKESNRVGAIEAFNRARKEKKKRGLDTAPAPIDYHKALVNAPPFSFLPGEHQQLSDNRSALVSMDTAQDTCTTVFCAAPKTLRKPTDNPQRQQTVRVQTQQQVENQGKCVLM